MRALRYSSVPQRVVLSVGLALMLLAVAVWWLLGDSASTNGWFAAEPTTSANTYFIVRERRPLALLMALAGVGIWTVFSYVLFGLRPSDPGRHEIA